MTYCQSEFDNKSHFQSKINDSLRFSKNRTDLLLIRDTDHKHCYS